MSYTGSIDLISGLRPKNNGNFPLIDAKAVYVDDDTRLDAALEKLENELSHTLFENAIICQEHMANVDSIICFGDSIFYGRTQENGVVTEQGNGTMQQFAALMGLPLTNLAVSGATLSTVTATSVVRQVQNWTPLSGKTPIILIDGGTNDQYEAQNLSNLGEYTDGVNGITNTIYGATYAIINNLLTKNIQPWQIVITTPIPKGIQGDDEGEVIRNLHTLQVADLAADISVIAQDMLGTVDLAADLLNLRRHHEKQGEGIVPGGDLGTVGIEEIIRDLHIIAVVAVSVLSNLDARDHIGVDDIGALVLVPVHQVVAVEQGADINV